MKAFLVVLALIVNHAAYAASIGFQVTATGFNATKSYTLSDADILRIIAANQIAANAAVNRTATRQEVLLYWIGQFVEQTKAAVQANDRQTAIDALVPPSPINPQ